jgi:hypothetical protein
MLSELERIRAEFGPAPAARRLALFEKLGRTRLASARALERFHECLLHARAYPDDAAVLARAVALLEGFARRPDLRRCRPALEDSGIAGTAIRFSFFWWTALWLAERWPGQLALDWGSSEEASAVEAILPLLVTQTEIPALDELPWSARRWLERLRGPGETGAAFLVRRWDRLAADGWAKEAFWDRMDLWLRLEPGPGTPSRTLAHHPRPRVVFQTGPLRRERPDLARELVRPPLAIRDVDPREADRLIALARGAMVTRARDLDVFIHADRRDARIVDCGDGLEFACLGVVPERRLLLESVYGFLTLKNGVPVGYVLASALFNSSEVAYNVFDTYRGGEAAWVYARVLAMLRVLFGSDTFAVDPYQLGYDNEEGLASGAWWFYRKLGFRPRDPATLALARKEESRVASHPRRRTPPARLERLASVPVFWGRGRARRDVLGEIGLGTIALHASRHLARGWGADREAGVAAASEEAARLLGVRSFRGFGAGERLAWERWAPLVCVLPGLGRWTLAERRALATAVRAKGGRRESDFVLLTNRHAPLRRALVRLAATPAD